MKNKYKILLFGVLMLCILLAYMGCKKDETTVGPNTGGNTTQQIQANGSLTPISRTQVQGTLFIANQNGNPITGITAQNITVKLVWGVTTTSATDSVFGTVNIQSLSQSGKNIAVALTMDYSGSMYSGPMDPTNTQYQRILDMENGAKTLINSLGTNDKAEIIKFADEVQVVQPLTTSKPLLIHAIDSSVDVGSMTALFQSIYQGIEDVATQSSSMYARAVVAMTDGGENSSSIDMPTLLATARSQGIPVYTIGLLDSTDHSTPPGLNSTDELNLVQIADSTGGFYIYAPSAAQLANIYNMINGQLSNAYTITITWPSATLPAAGTVVTVYVTINYNGMTTTYSRSYTI